AELELRFTLLDFGYKTILPALNVEYERHIKTEGNEDLDLGEESGDNHLELKGIISYYTENGEDITVNLNVGGAWGGEVDHKWESELTAGYLRPLDFVPGIPVSTQHPIRCGIEFRQQLNEDHHAGLGPEIGWRASLHLHLLAAFIFGLNERDDNRDELRVILEWEV